MALFAFLEVVEEKKIKFMEVSFKIEMEVSFKIEVEDNNSS